MKNPYLEEVMNLEGIVLSCYAGFYYVRDSKGRTWECKLRGIYRLKKKDVLAGDKVIFSKIDSNQGVIEEILPRKTELYRPPIANVDQLIIVTAVTNPEPDLSLIDRLLVLVEINSLHPIIIFNKVDLDHDNEEIIVEYTRIGYHTIRASVKKNIGIEEIRQSLANKVSVFAGASGVGKSSILNCIQPGISLKTGEISSKLKKGKHTTRYVQLMELDNGGLVGDTPGFSRLYLPKNMIREELGPLFPEIAIRQEQCKFSTCLHYKEPQCAIKKAVLKGEIAQWRYENYIQFLEEVIANERSF